MNNLQERILDIFKAVAAICNDNGIRYFAIGGTAIGAARHQGFVPWDDDLDIAVPIEDYGRLLAVARKELPDGFSVWPSRDVFHTMEVFSKVIDTRTTNIERFERRHPDSYKGVWIDIMPMSGVPSPGMRRAAFLKRRFVYYILNRRLRFGWRDCITSSMKTSWLATAPLRPFVDPERAKECFLKMLRAHPFDGAAFTGYTWSRALPRLIFPKEWFSDYVLMPFEDTQIRMPVGYHEYLTQQFGDYMTVPPPEQQVTHSGFVDLEHSYKDYQSGKLKIPDGFFD